jgi:hypothetical protein
MGNRRSLIVAACAFVASTEAFTASPLRPATESPTALDAVTRRESFGSLLGGALLPAIPAAIPQAAVAADEYPFIVSLTHPLLLVDVTFGRNLTSFNFMLILLVNSSENSQGLSCGCYKHTAHQKA